MAAPIYDSSAIEVLTGLEPVRKRPGMYTFTDRPDHLAQEVVDNAVDEAIAGYCTNILTPLHEDGSLSVADDGRGMPVDMHKGEKVPGVEVILTRLHSGAKFSDKSYRFSGGLHGVGVSVVNALSKRLEVRVKRDGKEHLMTFADGRIMKVSAIGTGFGKHAAAPAYQSLGLEVEVISPRDEAAVKSAMASDVDLISVHSPPFMHLDHVTAAIDHGHAVLCDKPFGRNTAEAEAMRERVREANDACTS